MTESWYTAHLQYILEGGDDVAPRGLACREVMNTTLSVERNNVVVNEVRHLNYRFLVAEWLWVWFGHDEVELLARYNPKMRAFSDDGVRLAGAYGPRLSEQLHDVVRALKNDESTRQAVLTIWRRDELQHPSKDVPCTVAAQFLVRGKRLHGIFTMRSSDAWLGIPYDVFTFTQLVACLGARLGIAPGVTTLNLGSAHLYEPDWLPALRAVRAPGNGTLASPSWNEEPPAWLDEVLVTGKGVPSRGDIYSPWSCYQQVLLSTTSADALRWLQRAWSFYGRG